MHKPTVFKRIKFDDFAKFERSREAEYQKNDLPKDFTVNGRSLNSDSRRQEMKMEIFPFETSAFLDTVKKSLLPGIGMGVVVTSLLVIIWSVCRFFYNNATHVARNHDSGRPNTPPATTCYAASEHLGRFTDSDNQTRYFKLQATTAL